LTIYSPHNEKCCFSVFSYPNHNAAEKSERVHIPSESKVEGDASIPPLSVPASIDDEEEPEDDAVKLGLGDFIFYRWGHIYMFSM
jgi:hypothetical protein